MHLYVLIKIEELTLVKLIILNPNVSGRVSGEEAFGLWTSMQEPYSHRTLSNDERIFNYRLSRDKELLRLHSASLPIDS